MLTSQTQAQFIRKMVAILLQKVVAVSPVLPAHVQNNLLDLMGGKICLAEDDMLSIYHCRTVNAV
jgi:hypothetical protein